MAAIIHQTDKRSGITYAYESISYWDKEKKQSRAKRKLIGRVDKETGEIVLTDGRGRRKKTSAEQSMIEAASTSRHFCTATYLLDTIGEKLGLAEDLKTCFHGWQSLLVIPFLPYAKIFEIMKDSAK